jgi:RHS repeat-associated protein
MTGSVVSGQSTTYAYDGFERLTQASGSAIPTTTYTYDSLDRLAQRNTAKFGYNDLSNTSVLSPMAAGETKLLRDPLGALLASKTGSAAGTLALDDPLHGDITGSVNPTTGDPSVTASFDPWGKPTSSGELPLGYQGGYTDPVTGLTNAHARWYSPGLGAFTSRDTFTLDPNPLAQSNRYLYANGSPLTGRDPDGHRVEVGDAVGPLVEQRAAEEHVRDDRTMKKYFGDDYKADQFVPQPTTLIANYSGQLVVATTDLYDITQATDGTLLVNGFVVPAGGPTSVQLADQLEDYCRQLRSFCEELLVCPYDFTEDECVEFWNQGVATLLEGALAGEFGTGYDDQLLGPLKDQIGQGLVDFGMSGAAAIGSLKGGGPRGGKTGGTGRGKVPLKSGATGGAKGVKQTCPAGECETQGASCLHSFVPETGVLMADGTTKLIYKIQPGDEVKATDPETWTTVPKTVTALHVNNDTGLTDLKVATAPPAAVGSSERAIDDANTTVDGTIHTTQHHPVWDKTSNAWVEASALVAGDQLRTDNSASVTVRSVRNFIGHMTMYDLTVSDIHTYYVVTGNTAVLVHNCEHNKAPFKNIEPQLLKDELATAERLGVKPLSPGEAGFDEVIRSGPVKWAVGLDGTIRVVPRSVGGEEISHAVIFGGRDVLAAGEARISLGPNGYTGDWIMRDSGHYRPCACSIQTGVGAFRSAGISFTRVVDDIG